jgi:adenylylsulfate kinase-like enzyme
MAKIYWLTGQPGAGKTVLAKKLVEFLQTEKRNWRKTVFHLDGDHLRDLTENKDYSKEGRINNIQRAQMIAEYIYKNDCDVVVSLVAPYRDVRDTF